MKSGEKKVNFFFVSLHYAFGWKYICHYSKHRVDRLKKKRCCRAWFFLFNSEYIFQTHGKFFFGTNFFYLCWSKLLKEFFLLWSIVVVSWYQALSTLKNQTKLRVIFDWGVLENKNNKGGLAAGCCCLENWAKLSKLSVQTNTM